MKSDLIWFVIWLPIWVFVSMRYFGSRVVETAIGYSIGWFCASFTRWMWRRYRG